jgi:Domain of unknown function (DUF6894)
MTRFFFHFSSKDDIVRDSKGRELSDLSEAHRHAMLLIHKMILLDDMDWRGWSVRITEADDRSMLSVLFPQGSYFQSGRKSGQPNRDSIG